MIHNMATRSDAGGKKASAKIKPTPPAPGRGRPSKYNAEFHPKIARALALAGRTDEQIAEELGVTTSTFYLWKKTYPIFSEALSQGKAEPDAMVERSLFELATGYEYDAEKPLVVAGPQGMGSEIQVAKYREKVPPNAASCIFWLKNRRPNRWRDKQEHELSGSLGVTIVDDI